MGDVSVEEIESWVGVEEEAVEMKPPLKVTSSLMQPHESFVLYGNSVHQRSVPHSSWQEVF